MAIMLSVAKNQPPKTISRSCVDMYFNRSEDFVKRNWNRDPFDFGMDSWPEEPAQCLSEESKDIVIASFAKEKMSLRELQREIEHIREKKKSTTSIHMMFLHSI